MLRVAQGFVFLTRRAARHFLFVPQRSKTLVYSDGSSSQRMVLITSTSYVRIHYALNSTRIDVG